MNGSVLACTLMKKRQEGSGRDPARRSFLRVVERKNPSYFYGLTRQAHLLGFSGE
jgi:hypothetical protein